MSDLAQVIEEPAGGHNHGRTRSGSDPRSGDRRIPLDVASAQAEEFVRSGGWTIVHVKDGDRAGVHAHRGVLHPDEFVDSGVIETLVENELGFTLDEVRSVYRQGRKSDAQLALRARIDARLLEIAETGGSMLELARVFGWDIDAGGKGQNCRTMERALARARGAA